VNGLGGRFTSADGKTQKLNASTAFSIQPPAFPFLLDELNPNNPLTMIEDDGITGAPQGVVRRLHITVPGSSDFLAGLKSRASEKTVWLQADGSPARIDFFRVAGDNHYARLPFTLLLSDYRKVSGIAVAFQQAEQLDGQTIRLLVLQSVLIGPEAGIGAADFTVSATPAGGAQ
jgi:hypothetical protein